MDKPYKLLIIDDNEETLTMLHAFFSRKIMKLPHHLAALMDLNCSNLIKKGLIWL